MNAAAPLPPLPASGSEAAWPRISILIAGAAAPSPALARTLDSLAGQGYPALEPLPVADDAAALNQAAARSTGAILALLQAGETLVPGALAAVAAFFGATPDRAAGATPDRAAGGAACEVLQGRCRLLDEEGRDTGLELPAEFADRRRLLAPWRGPCVARPALFWRRSAWERAGGLDAAEAPAAEYGLWCRLSRDHGFHRLDRVLASAPLPEAGLAEDLEALIRVSRRYWRPWSAAGAALALSWLGHRLRGAGPGPAALFHARLYAPWRRRLEAALRARRRPGIPTAAAAPAPQTLAALAETRPWPDGWVGPWAVFTLPRPPGPAPAGMRLSGEAEQVPLTLEIRTESGAALTAPLAAAGPFTLLIPATGREGAGVAVVEVRASAHAVPHARRRNHDHRPLSWRFRSLEIAATPPA
jgi:hypothetical protein